MMMFDVDGLRASITTEPQTSQTTHDEARTWKAAAYDAQQQTGTKCRVISISTKYITLELDEPTNLQQGQSVRVSKV